MSSPEKRQKITEVYAMIFNDTFLPIYVIYTLFIELGLKEEQEPIKYILYLRIYIPSLKNKINGCNSVLDNKVQFWINEEHVSILFYT